MKPRSKSSAPYVNLTVTADVDVEIDPDDLHEDGWHHKTECGWTEETPIVVDPLDRVGYVDAIASLHRQAHPSQHRDPVLCHEEPCRSFNFWQLREPTPNARSAP